MSVCEMSINSYIDFPFFHLKTKKIELKVISFHLEGNEGGKTRKSYLFN
jgi:hypothetical protein